MGETVRVASGVGSQSELVSVIELMCVHARACTLSCVHDCTCSNLCARDACLQACMRVYVHVRAFACLSAVWRTRVHVRAFSLHACTQHIV